MLANSDQGVIVGHCSLFGPVSTLPLTHSLRDVFNLMLRIYTMISTNRGECQEQILKFPGARYKKFATRELAQSFIGGSDNPAEGRPRWCI